MQAAKTLEAYLQRIKTLTSSYPETVIPSPTAASEVATPRMGTVQTDNSSWTGWAISSFTNKLGTASGEIQRVQSPAVASMGGDYTRSASVPTMSPSRLDAPIQSKTISASSFNRTTLTSPRPASSFLDDADNEDNDPEAWGDLDEDNFFDAPEPNKPKSQAPLTTKKSAWDFDDTEPDISAMLNKSKAPLPKGLAKKSTTAAPRIGFGSANASGKGSIVAARQPVKTGGTTKPIVGGAAAKKTEVKKIEDPWGNDDDADWGDSWDK